LSCFVNGYTNLVANKQMFCENWHLLTTVGLLYSRHTCLFMHSFAAAGRHVACVVHSCRLSFLRVFGDLKKL